MKPASPVPPKPNRKTMTPEEYAVSCSTWAWAASHDERAASRNDWINSVAAQLGLKKCVPRSQYHEGYPPGYYRNKPDPWRIQSIAQADSGYPALNPEF